MSTFTDWWAWDGENFFYLGSYDNIEDAYDNDNTRGGPSSHWVHSRESLTEMVERALVALNK